MVAYCGLIGKLIYFDTCGLTGDLCSQLREKMLWRDVESIGEL